MAVVFDAHIAFHHGVRADAGVGANVDATQQQPAAFDACVLQVHGVADACALANRHQPGHAHGERSQVDLGANLRAQSAQPRHVKR